MIIRVLSTLALVAMVSGCTIHQSIGDNFGSAMSKPKGQDFKPVGPRWDFEHNALLYVYRPSSKWADDEFEAPSFNVNDKRLFNIKGGAYTWYELIPGDYDVVMRRGLFGIEGFNDIVLKKISEFALHAEAGEVYYLRYSEIDPPKENEEHQHRVAKIGDGPLQLVSAELALDELSATKMLHHGRDLLKPRSVVEDKDLQRVFEGQVDPKTEKPATKEEWWPF